MIKYNRVIKYMEKLKIHFLNTIWSDSILLETNNKFALVDTASPFYYPMVKKHLDDLNIKELEFILLTHFHVDHYGNMKNIINDFKVKKIYLKKYYGLDGTTSSGYDSNEEYIANEFKNYENILEAAKNNNTEIIFFDEYNENMVTIDFMNIPLELYDANNLLYELYSNPESEFYNQKRFNENFNSIGIFIKINNNNIFLGGDATCSNTDIKEVKELSIKMINRIYDRHNIDHIDIYKSCHHGGGGTNTLSLCKLLKAKYAIITNTARWLDTYDTYKNLTEGNKDVAIMPTDYQKYIFDISESISYEVIKEESLFLTLKKN